MVDMPEPEIKGVESLLESVENEELLHILMAADRKTLQIVLLKMMGYSIPEIIIKTGMSKRAVYCRIHRLKKKIKKFFKEREKRGGLIGYIVEGKNYPLCSLTISYTALQVRSRK